MDNEYKKYFSTALRYLMKKNDWATQKYIGYKVGKSQSHISKIVTGQAFGQIDLLLKITKLFDTTLEQMLELGRCIIQHGADCPDLPDITASSRPEILKKYEYFKKNITKFHDIDKAMKFGQILLKIEHISPEKYDRLYRFTIGYLAQIEIQEQETGPVATKNDKKNCA